MNIIKKITVLTALVLLSGYFIISGHKNAARRPDFRDAVGDSSGGAINSLNSSAGNAGINIPEPAAPSEADNKNHFSEKRFGQDPVPVHGYTLQQEKIMAGHNRALSFSKSNRQMVSGKYRPYADYEKTGYLIMSWETNFASLPAKLEMAKNLPADAFLVIFADGPSDTDKEAILQEYESVIPRGRIKVISLPGARSSGFWARDCMPVPVLGQDNSLTVIDAKYMYPFEPDSEISRLFKCGLEKHDYCYEGGNFQANAKGDCVMVNNEPHAKIPDDIFTGLYGCKTLTRLPFIDGIGHVDERARFINEKTLVTDTPAYKDLLEAKGFIVYLLPRPYRPYETYVNSLIMNDHVVVPVFSQPTDAQALAVYEKLGLKASGADSISLSNTGLGSVHCITMTYPKMPVSELLKALGAKEVR